MPDSDTKVFVMTTQIQIKMNGASPDEIKSNLHRIINNAVANGLVTDDSEAEIMGEESDPLNLLVENNVAIIDLKGDHD